MNQPPAASLFAFRAFLRVAALPGFRTLIMVVALAFPGLVMAEATAGSVPADRAGVIATYGNPTGTMRVGDREILSYPDRKVVIVDGRVVSSTLTPATPTPRPTPTPAPVPATAPTASPTESGNDSRSTLIVPTPLPLQPVRNSMRSPTPMPTRYYPARPTPPPSHEEAMVLAGQNFIQVAKGSARLYYDPQMWVQLKSPNADMRALSHRSANLHVVMNAQAGNFSLSDPASILLGRLRARDPMAQVLRQENRNVKGGEITFVRALGSPGPARVEYFYYVHCGTRFVSYIMLLGPQTEAEQNEADITKLLDGFEIPDANAEPSAL